MTRTISPSPAAVNAELEMEIRRRRVILDIPAKVEASHRNGE
jgi:hypothetical protein